MINDQMQSVEKIAEATRDIIVRLGDSFDKYLGSPAVEMGGIAGDWMKYYRYKNMLTILDKVEELHRQRKLEGRPIPISPRMAIPLLDAVSAEDDETLQNLWARLIANSTDPNTLIPIHPGYIEIIKQLTPDEAVIVNAFSKADDYPTIFGDEIKIDSRFGTGFADNNLFFAGIYRQYSEFCNKLALSKPEKHMSYLDNLKRLRIVEVRYESSTIMKNNELSQIREVEVEVYIIQTRYEFLSITTLGDDFLKACN